MPSMLDTKPSQALPVKYMDTKKAWMTAALFEDVLLGINMYFRKLGREIVLIVDGAVLLSC